MRKIMLSAVVATVAALSFAAPSQAGGFSIGFGHGHGGWDHGGWGHGHGHGAHVTVYDDYGYDCFWKKVKRYDKWGNLVIKKIRICD
ncbi:hypothetical protein [Shinella zoogloeoides]|uniref:hypothetical protein n=1 Tax=Shinella zoogloeoides TaxID=352475 RepID=UPI00273F1575|nr:hypothetical protein [Shinella zoogloeoides]WLR92093.1 hypothetical protein Q9316_16725 [Shinella zoogloeoides]